MPAPVRYEVRVLGRVGPAARDAFADFGVRVGPTSTVLSGALDQAALHSLLERIQALGMEVVDVRRLGMGPLPSRSSRSGLIRRLLA